MKKTIATAAVLSVLILSAFVHSQGPGAGPRPGMGPGMMDSTKHAHMMGKHMMMGGMMAHSLVATTDGGVVLMAGNRLYKYDKNLAAIKDVEVKIDTASMRKWRDAMKSMKD